MDGAGGSSSPKETPRARSFASLSSSTYFLHAAGLLEQHLGGGIKRFKLTVQIWEKNFPAPLLSLCDKLVKIWPRASTLRLLARGEYSSRLIQVKPADIVAKLLPTPKHALDSRLAERHDRLSGLATFLISRERYHNIFPFPWHLLPQTRRSVQWSAFGHCPRGCSWRCGICFRGASETICASAHRRCTGPLGYRGRCRYQYRLALRRGPVVKRRHIGAVLLFVIKKRF